MHSRPNAWQIGHLKFRAAPTPLSKEAVGEMLRIIPSRPAYLEWVRIASAVFATLGEEEGIAMLMDWSPEEKLGEYAKLFRYRMEKVGSGTLVHIATTHGWSRTHDWKPSRQSNTPPAREIKQLAPLKKRPSLPQFRAPRLPELRALMRLRGLGASSAGLELMVERGLLHVAPAVYETDEAGKPMNVAAFLLTDDARKVSLMRRCDGKYWNHIGGKKSKTWTAFDGASRWPIGAAHLANVGVQWILLVEGFPDMMATYTLLMDFAENLPIEARNKLLQSVRIIAMASGVTAIAPDALPLFAGKHVRLVPHDDLHANPGAKENAGESAAQKWAAQLYESGADVSIFRLRAYLPPGGKDLCDAAAHAFRRESTPLTRETGTHQGEAAISMSLVPGDIDKLRREPYP